MDNVRSLVVVADDFGIGLPTSRAILELARQGIVTGSVLLVNSPCAEEAVRQWREADRPMVLGWHPNLTLDRPVVEPERVPSLVDAEGNFWRLDQFLTRLCTRRIRREDVETELAAQLRRFIELVGESPRLVNSHQHIQIFPPVGNVLSALLMDLQPRPYVRRIIEPFKMLTWIPGSRLKRAFLTLCGARQACQLDDAEFPGNDWLAGVADPCSVADPEFFPRWLTSIPGDVVELSCHPGYYDESLIGRECRPDDPLLMRRVHELTGLRKHTFRWACARAGFVLTAPTELILEPRLQHAA